MNFTVRTATAADVGAMHRLRMRTRENRLSRATAVRHSTYLPYVGAGSAWVAETDGVIVGFAAVDAPAERVWALFVDADAEGSGVGRALHRRMLSWARGEGIGRLSLGTERGSRAVGFYGRAGWSQTGVTEDGEVLFERAL